MKRTKRFFASLLACTLLALLVFSGCSNPEKTAGSGLQSTPSTQENSSPATPAKKGTLAVYSAYQEDESQFLFDLFEKETGIEVKSVRLSAGEMFARVQAEASNPQAGLLLGVPTDTLDVAGAEGLLESYTPKTIDQVPESLQDPNAMWTGHTLSIMCIISNTEILKELGKEAPSTWDDVLDSAFKDNVVMPHPATSGTGYVFLASRLFDLDETAGFEYMKKLDANITQYAKGGAAPARMVGLGESAVGICLSADALNTQATGQPVTITYPEDGVSINITGMALVKNAPENQVENAKAFINWAIGKQAQESYANQYQRVPVNEQAALPQGMVPYSELNTIVIDSAWSAENRDRIIDYFEDEIRNPENVLQ